jgi:hypothetical protein
MKRDKTLYFKKGYKYWVNRPYYINIVIHPLTTIYISFKTVDIKGNVVEIPMASLNSQGDLVIYPSYVWDGASGPTWDTLNSMIGSLIHDVLYQFIRLGLIDTCYKSYADQLLHDLCTEDGMWSLRADYWQWAVNNFGANACKPSAEHLELVAP